MKKIRIVLFLGLLTLFVVGIGTVEAIKLLSKADEIKLKQEMKPLETERDVEMIGIFAPGFEVEVVEAKARYTKEYGEGKVSVVDYQGYTLIVPPGKESEVSRVKEKVVTIINDQYNRTPSKNIEDIQISKIRAIFDVIGGIVYNSAIGAFTDEKGFQYNFVDGELVNKQVGITSALQAKFNKAYPHLNPETKRTAVISYEEVRRNTDKIIDKSFSVDRAVYLKSKVQRLDLDDARIGIIYGETEVQIMVDQVTGDIIHYSKIK